MTFKEYAYQWIEIKKDYIKESTLIRYKNLIALHLNPEFGDYELNDITQEKVKKWVFDWLDTGEVKKETVNQAFNTLKLILKDAYISKQTTIILSPIKYPRKYDEKKEEIEVFSLQEYQKIIDYCTAHATSRNIAILLVCFTGMRIGEVCALQYKDIDLVYNQINISKTLQRICDKSLGKSYLSVGSGKTINSIRTIPIVGQLKLFLEKQMRGKPENYYLVTDSFNPCEPRNLRKIYKTMLQHAGVRDLKFHGLRHSFATRLLSKGVDVKTVSSIIGHSKVQTTMDLYVHPSKQTQMDAINKAFNKI